MNRIEKIIEKNVSDGIKFVKLGNENYFKITMGQSPDGKSVGAYNTGMEFHQGKTMFTNFIISHSNLYTSNPIRIANANSVLMSVRAPVGAINYTDREICIGRGLCSIQTTDKVLSKFLYYLMKIYSKELSDKATGSTFSSTNKNSIRELIIPLPPLSQQQEIVQLLDKAGEMIELRKKQLATLDTLAESVFYQMFGDPVTNEKGWEMRCLGELGEWKSGGTPPRKNEEYYKGSIPWVISGELSSIFIDNSHEHITDFALKNSNAKIIKVGSLLLGMYDTAALKSSISLVPLACNQAIAFSFLNEIISNTLYVYFSIQIGKETHKKLQRGIRQKNLNLSMIKNLEIPLPPLALQQEFAAIVEKIEEEKALTQTALKQSEDLFQRLMQDLFPSPSSQALAVDKNLLETVKVTL